MHVTIESIARGTRRPEVLELWLDDQASFSGLTPGLKRLQKRGLSVKLGGHYGPHGKYYPHVQAANNLSHSLVTADDDIMYPKWWLRGLVEANLKNPSAIHCYRAHEFTLEEGFPASYDSWKPCTTTIPTFRTYFTGVSGVIYPPKFLAMLRLEGTQFLKVSPRADDVWLNAQAVKHGFKGSQVFARPIEFSVIPGTQSIALNPSNSGESGNDAQIVQTYGVGQLARIAETGS